MAFFRKSKGPIHVGELSCSLDNAGAAYVYLNNDERVGDTIPAAIWPCSWAVRVLVRHQEEGRFAAGRDVIATCLRFDSPIDMNAEYNPAGIHDMSRLRPDAVRASISGVLAGDRDEHTLFGMWQGRGQDRISDIAPRVFAALWHVAEVNGVGPAVRFAMQALDGSIADLDGLTADAEHRMPDTLARHGVEMQAMEETTSFSPEQLASELDTVPSSGTTKANDWTVIRQTAGGFAVGTWNAFTHGSDRLSDGVWRSMHSPSTGRLALGFEADAGPRLLVPAEEITSATVTAKGINFAVEVRSEGGDFVCVGPRSRVREIFNQLGFHL